MHKHRGEAGGRKEFRGEPARVIREVVVSSTRRVWEDAFRHMLEFYPAENMGVFLVKEGGGGEFALDRYMRLPTFSYGVISPGLIDLDEMSGEDKKALVGCDGVVLAHLHVDGSPPHFGDVHVSELMLNEFFPGVKVVGHSTTAPPMALRTMPSGLPMYSKHTLKQEEIERYLKDCMRAPEEHINMLVRVPGAEGLHRVKHKIK